MKTIEKNILILAKANRLSLLAKTSTNTIENIINIAQTKLDLTLIPVFIDLTGSSLLMWGKNDDPAPGTIEQLLVAEYKLKDDFKHRQLYAGVMNELKTNNLYLCVNYMQRTLFIAKI